MLTLISIPYLLAKLISFPKHVLLWIYHLKRKSDERLNNMSHIWKLISNFSQKKVTVCETSFILHRMLALFPLWKLASMSFDLCFIRLIEIRPCLTKRFAIFIQKRRAGLNLSHFLKILLIILVFYKCGNRQCIADRQICGYNLRMLIMVNWQVVSLIHNWWMERWIRPVFLWGYLRHRQ